MNNLNRARDTAAHTEENSENTLRATREVLKNGL